MLLSVFNCNVFLTKMLNKIVLTLFFIILNYRTFRNLPYRGKQLHVALILVVFIPLTSAVIMGT